MIRTNLILALLEDGIATPAEIARMAKTTRQNVMQTARRHKLNWKRCRKTAVAESFAKVKRCSVDALV